MRDRLRAEPFDRPLDGRASCHPQLVPYEGRVLLASIVSRIGSDVHAERMGDVALRSNAGIQRAPQAIRWNDQSEPTEPVARATAMRRNHKNLDVSARYAIENVVRKAWHSIAPNAGTKFGGCSGSDTPTPCVSEARGVFGTTTCGSCGTADGLEMHQPKPSDRNRMFPVLSIAGGGHPVAPGRDDQAMAAPVSGP